MDEYFDKLDLEEINRFVSEGQEENLQLEFKTVNFPYDKEYSPKFTKEQAKKDDKKNLSKALSGFANSTGGIIIWGIKAKKKGDDPDVAEKLMPIENLKRFVNELNTLEGGAVIPRIEGVKHIPIDIGNDKGFVKTFIPPSDNAPHMGIFADKRYYKRSGDSFYICEHFDIVDIFSRRTAPKLFVELQIVSPEGIVIRTALNTVHCFKIRIGNSGKQIGKFPYLSLKLPTHIRSAPFGLDGNKGRGLRFRYSHGDTYPFIYRDENLTVIHPETYLDVDYLFFEVDSNDKLTDVEIEYMLIAEGTNIIRKTITIKKAQFVAFKQSPDLKIIIVSDDEL